MLCFDLGVVMVLLMQVSEKLVTIELQMEHLVTLVVLPVNQELVQMDEFLVYKQTHLLELP